MEIHELNDYSGSLGATDYLAIDDGSDTGKVSAKRIIDEAVGQMPPSIFYGTSSTSASTATKIVSCSDFTELFTGATIAVKFTYAQTSTSYVYLNVNSTGAKQVYGIARSTTSTTRMDGAWEANEVKVFVYDGTYWRIVDRNIITSSELSTLESALGVASGVVGRLNAVLSAIASRIIATNAGTRVILSSYTGGSIYTFPSDGYLTVRAAAASGAKAYASIMDASGNAIGDIGYVAGTSYPAVTVFVKKGMKVTVVEINSNGSVHFTPLTS